MRQSFINLAIGSLMALFVVASSVQFGFADDWSQWLGDKRDSVWRESGIIKSIPKDGLKVLWRTPIAGGFSGPAVAGDRVFVTDYVLKKGDQAFDPGKRSQLEGSERIHCLDRETGKPIWQKSHERNYSISYGLGPRATPTVDDDKVYFLGAEGHLDCYSVADGAEVWNRDLKKDFKIKESPISGGHHLGE